jgi:glycosyltransferase involved in cell wall biosynthesis
MSATDSADDGETTVVPREIRILSVITRVVFGGAERRIQDVFRAMPEANHLVVVGRDSDPLAVEQLAEQVELIQSPYLVRAVEPRNDLRAVRQLHQLMRRGSFDIVHTHHAKSGVVGRIAARAAGVPIVYHAASGASFGPSYGRLESTTLALAERFTAPLVSRYFVVGHDLAAQLADNGISRRRIEVLRSSLDLAPFSHDGDAGWLGRRTAWRREMGIGLDEVVVCYVGRLDQFKGVRGLPALVQAASDARQGPQVPVTLIMAGTGPLREELATESESLHRGRPDAVTVRLLGHVSSVAEVMAGSDVLVLPSPKEGLPQVLVQAAASGLPFVAYAVDGVSELRAMGAAGRVVPLYDGDGYRAALTEELDRAGGSVGRSAPDPRRWAEWDPAVVAERYRIRHHDDLARRRHARWAERISRKGVLDQAAELPMI